MSGIAMSRVASMRGSVHPEGALKPPHSLPDRVYGPLQRGAAYMGREHGPSDLFLAFFPSLPPCQQFASHP